MLDITESVVCCSNKGEIYMTYMMTNDETEAFGEEESKPKTSLLNTILNKLGIATKREISEAKNLAIKILRDEYTRRANEKGKFCVRGSLGKLKVCMTGEKLGEFMSIEQEFRELRNLINIYEYDECEFFKDEAEAFGRIADINALSDTVEETDDDL